MEKYSEGYDLYLLDINLREEVSFPLLEKIKQDYPKSVCLMFSGYDSEENIRTAKGLGADGFIPKPFKIEFLEQFVFPKVKFLKEKFSSTEDE